MFARQNSIAVVAVLFAATTGATAQAVEDGGTGARCRSDTSTQVSPALSGRIVTAVHIVTQAPAALPGPMAVVHDVHVRTRLPTIRQELLFQAGDTVDTLRVAESLRRLRHVPFLAEVALVTTACGDGGAVTLGILTRDLWSTRPVATLHGGGSAVLGLAEGNFLGRGDRAKLYLRWDGSFGLGGSYATSSLLHQRLSATVGHSASRDRADWLGVIGTRERSVFDVNHAALTAGRSYLQSPVTVGDTMHRSAASLLVTRRVAASPHGATGAIVGAEFSRATLLAGATAPIVGPAAVRRSFVGVDLGATRRSAAYATNTWYLPQAATMDVPLGFEGEAVVGVGRDLAYGRSALHVDAWGGRAWLPAHHTLMVITDLWGSGFLVRGASWSAARIRAAARADRAGWRGRWSVGVAAEQLSDPDPDMRALAMTDPTLWTLPARDRLAETAVTASLERMVHLSREYQAYVVDGAVFTAGSMRWDRAAPGSGALSRAVLGIGLRLVSTRLGQPTVRVDLGVPSFPAAGVRRRVYLAVSLTPSYEVWRRRDGRRLQ